MKKGVEESAVKNRLLLFILLTLSGFCGISYEILYGRILGNLLGDQFSVSASVLLTFLLGIAIGTRIAHRLWRFLWLIEGGIGASGILAVTSSDRLLTIVGAIDGGVGSIVLACGLMLLFPALLIGCTMPLFAGYLSALKRDGAFARAYGIYNFGAAATAIVVEIVLVRSFGLRATVFAIAAINATVSAILFIAFRTLAPEARTRSDAPVSRREIAALVLASVGSAILQLTMIKLSESFLGPFRETFALVLGVVLLGMAVGTPIVHRLRLELGHVLIAALASIAWVLASLRPITEAYAALHPIASEDHVRLALLEIAVLVILFGPATAAFGSTIPALVKSESNISQDAGRLLFFSSLANAAGFLVMVLVLHEALDYGDILLAVAAIAGAAMAVLVLDRRRLAPIGLFALCAVIAARAGLWDEGRLYLGHTAFHSSADLARETRRHDRSEVFKRHDDAFAIRWSNGKPYFYINGYISCPLRTPAETIVGAYASIFSPRFDDALVLGVGSGSTAGAVSLLFDHTDGVEINQAVLDHLDRMHEFNFAIDRNPRVTLVHDDAIHFMRSSARTYSMVLNTVTSPLYFSSSKLYTHDFFESVRRRLSPDGIYVTWFDSRVGDRGADIILETLSRSFRECALGAVKSSYFLLVCSNAPIVAHDPLAVAREPSLGRYLLAKYGVVPEWIPYGTLTMHAFDLRNDRAAPINTLDHPVLEFHMAELGTRSIAAFKARVEAVLAPESLIFAPWQTPIDLAIHQRRLLGDSRIAAAVEQRLRTRVPDFDRALAAEKLRLDRFYALNHGEARDR
jgi:predicted membrane-bound spermidine synthase